MTSGTFGPGGSSQPQGHTELATVGPVIDIAIQGVEPPGLSVPARGLIDTGASVVCIDRRIALQLGLRAVNQADVHVPGGLTVQTTVYMGIVSVPVLGFEAVMPLYSASMMQASHDALLGRSFLKNFVVTFNGPEGMFHFYAPFSFPGPPPDDDYAS